MRDDDNLDLLNYVEENKKTPWRRKYERKVKWSRGQTFCDESSISGPPAAAYNTLLTLRKRLHDSSRRLSMKWLENEAHRWCNRLVMRSSVFLSHWRGGFQLSMWSPRLSLDRAIMSRGLSLPCGMEMWKGRGEARGESWVDATTTGSLFPTSTGSSFAYDRFHFPKTRLWWTIFYFFKSHLIWLFYSILIWQVFD